MLNQVAGITRVRMLYLQLHYRCNFRCRHCFHGDLLESPDALGLGDVQVLLAHFRDEYRLEAVTLLGGEPLMYPHIVSLCRYAKQLSLNVEICTNGHPGFRDKIEAVAPVLDKLRVSLDGLHSTHDRMRQRGSFDGALKMIDLASGIGITVGATMTVTEHNLDEVVPLAQLLQRRGVTELKLHALRLVGNAARNQDLQVIDINRYSVMHQRINDAGLDIPIFYDADLSAEPAGETCSNLIAGGWLDRIEADPRGGLTVSCKAVGRNVNAFRWDRARHEIVYEPNPRDELAQGIPDVIYQTAARN
jgi:MoaA/NifB/PqqE/SkfB family radical SAM enzyme